MLAKPAISVMPVIALRAWCPYSRTSVENAASYSPLPMPTPTTSHASSSDSAPCAAAIAARPAAKTTLVAISTGRPPKRSIARPAIGPTSAETTSAAEKAANTAAGARPRSRAIGAARIAAR